MGKTVTIITTSTTGPVGDAVTRLTDLIAERGMTLFAVIDHSAAATQVGLQLRPTVVVLFGSPAAGTPVMAAAPLAAIDLPLRILVWDDDGQTKISYTDPAELAARYDLSPELASRLAGINALADAMAS